MSELEQKIHKAKIDNPSMGMLRISKLVGCSKSYVRFCLNSTFKEKHICRQAHNRKINISSLKTLHGGKCVICGYSKCLAALDFHHPDPSKKTGSVSVLMSINKSKATEEAKKCTLVCRNCHMEIHAGLHEMEPRTGIEPAV